MFIWIPGLHFGVYNIVSWIVIGLLAGFLASKIVRGKGYGCLGDTIVGLIGAVVGGFLASLLGFGSGFSFVGTLVIAFLGAVIFLWLLNILSGDRKR
jgi:uncharacterized membrane protein YeaQ/YmgE (transglycosylase-associated protein family)